MVDEDYVNKSSPLPINEVGKLSQHVRRGKEGMKEK